MIFDEPIAQERATLDVLPTDSLGVSLRQLDASWLMMRR